MTQDECALTVSFCKNSDISYSSIHFELLYTPSPLHLLKGYEYCISLQNYNVTHEACDQDRGRNKVFC